MDILLIDDNDADLAISASLIEQAGHTPITCQYGEKALEFFNDDHNAPYLIIIDWEMHDMDGSELCQRLRALPFTVSPYIILTSAEEFSDAEVTALEHGADDFIEKPMTLRSLSARIRVAERIISNQMNLRNLALTDGLTGLLNRRAGMTAIETQMARIKRHQEMCGCVVMCDIDYFKKINDNYGHVAGDIVLKEVATRMSESLRPFDTVCRYGGEEFLIFCEADGSEIHQILDRIMDVVSSESVQIDNGDQLDVTLSMGCHVNDSEEEHSLSSQLKQADALLYQAKGNGRNQYVTNLASA